MKQQYNNMKALVWLLAAAVCVPCMLSWAATIPWRVPLGVAVGDTIVQEADDDDLLPGTYPVGTLSRDSVEDSIEDLYVYIKAVGRTYGDSVVLRWAVESYPEWDRLNRTGYDVLRHTEGEGEFLLDTLATGIRPMSLADFRRCYPDTIDSLAYLAMGAIYGEGDMTPEMTNYEPGSIGALVELEQDQKTRLFGAFLAAEWRPDLAQAMGLRYVDKTAKKGETYTYFIMPSVPDTTGRFFIMPAQVENLHNVKYVPDPYDVAISDTILEHGSVALSWRDDLHGTFDVFWRKMGEQQWRKVNELPYAPPFRVDQEDADFLPTQTFYLDVPQFGKEYVKNLLFVIAYTNVRPANVSFSLRYYDAELKDHLLDYKIFEFSDYDFSGDDLDLDNMKKWTKKGYELLQ